MNTVYLKNFLLMILPFVLIALIFFTPLDILEPKKNNSKEKFVVDVRPQIKGSDLPVKGNGCDNPKKQFISVQEIMDGQMYQCHPWVSK